MNSEAHRAALLKVLNQAHVAHNITIENFDHIVGNIMAADFLNFNDEEIPLEGRGHTKHSTFQLNVKITSLREF